MSVRVGLFDVYTGACISAMFRVIPRKVKAKVKVVSRLEVIMRVMVTVSHSKHDVL